MKKKSHCGISNPKSNKIGTEKLTVNQLKTLIGDDKITDDLAENIIDSLYQLSVIAYQIIK